MKIVSIVFALVAMAAGLTSCQSTGSSEPPREKLSSLPHNQPASWEGQAGFGGFQNQY